MLWNLARAFVTTSAERGAGAMDKIMEPLQRLGKALMGAVAVMPLAALMMGIGYWITSVGGEGAVIYGDLLLKTGAAVLDNLGVIFAIAIAYGLSRDNSGAAALAGFVGFATLVNLIGPEAVAGYRGIEPTELTGDEALRWAESGWDAVGYGNVLFGIMIGILAAWIYNRFYQTQLPDAFAFFSGRRLVPILSSIFSAVVAGIMYIIWPLVYSALFSFGAWIQGLGAVGAGLYGFANRLLIPTGLHHALNSVFWFDVMGIDDIRKFQEGPVTIDSAAAATDALSCPGVWDGTTCEVIGVVGQYQAGFFPIMMFGLPGAALAIYLRAKTKRRKAVGALMMAAAVASFFTGVTEPLEFSFMFLAPLLYLVHAILTGISLAIASAMGWTAGFGFSAGAVDFLLSSQNPLANQWWMLLVMGVIYFFAYLGIFYALIGLLNIKTPGRDDDESEDGGASFDAFTDIARPGASKGGADNANTHTAEKIILGLGGKNNIDSIDYCSTRLRTHVHDASLVDESLIRKAAASGMVRPTKQSIQVIVGTKVQFVYDEVARLLAQSGADAELIGERPASELDQPATTVLTGTTVELSKPTVGQVIALEGVSDDAFASKSIGDGFALVPASTAAVFDVCAPASGKLDMVFKTNHAFSLTTSAGLEVLVHIGFDTVKLKGEGFTRLVEQGQFVETGQPIVRVDAKALRAQGVDLTIAVVMPTKAQTSSVHLAQGKGSVAAEVALR